MRTLLFLVLAGIAHAADWPSLERYQHTITRAEFNRLLSSVYSPTGDATNYLDYSTNSVTIFSTPARTNALFTLHFASSPISNLQSQIHRIALDPGHIGGEWARMEERFFVRAKDRPVQEAVLNLIVARLLKTRLETAGLEVVLTKNNLEPVTDKRPEHFRAEAEAWVAGRTNQFASFPPLEREAGIADAIRKRQELLFYRSAEIAARARKLNDDLKPDLTICLHFNAAPWNDRHDLTDANGLTIFVHGNYLPDEIEDDDQKFCLFSKLLERSHDTELAIADAIAKSLAQTTSLVPLPSSSNSAPVSTNPHLLFRNIAANRLYHGPVIYLEPYFMNNRIVYQRLQLGDYAGTREIEGCRYPSIFREYADAVAAGLLAWLQTANGDTGLKP